MTVYDRTFTLPVAFPPQTFSGNIADVLAAHGRTNLRLAETEKYAHVTYFFNCGREEPYRRRRSRAGARHRRSRPTICMPEMSARASPTRSSRPASRRRHDVVICNFANADMVGHTGNLEATIARSRPLDACLGRIVTALRSPRAARRSSPPITATPSRCGTTELNAPHTAHTTNPVPVISGRRRVTSDDPLADGTLRDVAPTMLAMLGFRLEGDDGQRLARVKIRLRARRQKGGCNAKAALPCCPS